jgi:DNA-binding transcriptional ArsR family regulator
MTHQPAVDALADPARRQVFEYLRAGPSSLDALAEQLPLSRAALAQHVQALQDAGLVSEQSEGSCLVYGIDPDGLAAVRRWLDQFWDEAFAAFAAKASAIGTDKA